METIYTHDQLKEDLIALEKACTDLKILSIGQSTFGREIYLVRIGRGQRKVHINGAHHANEWITSKVIIESMHKLIKREDLRDLLEKVTYDFIPMVNPDGIAICAADIPEEEKDFLLQANEYSEDFSRWRANGRGVDLNRNYAADFERCKQLTSKKEPSYGYYPGEYAQSEKETITLVNLTIERKYDMVLAYHTQGEEIFWEYNDIVVPQAEAYAKKFSKVSGYRLSEPEENALAGGYKDWFIEAFKKPGFTIECGIGTNPLSINQLDSIVEKTFPILLEAGKE